MPDDSDCFTPYCACARGGNAKARLEAVATMVENRCLQISFLLTALLVGTTSIPVVSGQSGEWLISESD